MSQNALFITDLHGNIGALRRAVETAQQDRSLEYLIVGGDIAPNLVVIKLRDGEFAIRHEARYDTRIASGFREALVKRRVFRPDGHHGKCALFYHIDLDCDAFLRLSDRETHEQLLRPSSFEYLREQQEAYVVNELLPLLRSYRDEGIKVYAMLGNDDFLELESLLLEAEREDVLQYVHERVCPLGTMQIVGYSCVLSKPFRYRAWERSEEEIAEALAKLTSDLDSTETILSVHMPPYATKLDMLGATGEHVGSRAVRQLLEDRQFAIGLFGHVHESHLVSGSRNDQINATQIFNPGGYHESTCCGLLFDPSMPASWQGLWNGPSA